MRKTICLVGAATALCAPSMALGQVLWSDDMESYTVGTRVNGVNRWTGWDGSDTYSAEVSDEQAFDGTKSAKIYDPGIPGGIDAVVDWSVDNYTSGAFNFITMQYVPGTLTGASYFIMLNTFAVGGTATNNWSTQVQFTDAGEVVADFDGETLPLITDEWVELRVAIDLDDDTYGAGFGRQIFSYGGAVLYDDTWTERVSGGGDSRVDALDLFNNGAGEVYYDGLGLNVQPQEGACCFDDGTCTDPTPRVDCLNNGGDYQGNGTLCSGSFCPVCTGECDFGTDVLVSYCSYPLPNTVQSHAIADDTTGEADLGCSGQFPSGNDVHEIVIEENGVYWFSMCNASSFQDNIVYLYSDCSCSSLITSNFDACTGGFSEVSATLTVGTYYVSVEGFGITEGEYVLNVFQKCILECPSGSADENEPDCAVGGEVTNGGCNMAPGTEVFSPLECTTGGYVVCGTTANDGGTRDTDWYAITVDATKVLTWAVEGETDMVSGFIETVDGKFGSADCNDGSGYISPFAVRPACLTGTTSIVATTENDATYYLFVATPFGDVVDCGTLYIATMGCEDLPSGETVCPDDANNYLKTFGGPVTGDALRLCEDDDSRLEVLQSAQLSPLLPHLRLEYWANTSFPSGEVTQLDYNIWSHVSALVGGGQNPNTQRTYIFNYCTNRFEIIDQRGTGAFADENIMHTQSENASCYVNPADGEIKVRQEAWPPGLTFSPNWALKVDLFEVTVSQ